MRVAIYARTSRAEGGDETSIPVQLADCRERAEAEGWEVIGEYVDAGISGWKRKSRPGYEALFAHAEAARIDAVLVRDYERLLRNDKEGTRWLDLFDATGFGRFAFADEADINLARARDRKDFKDRVSAAVYYSDRLSEKVRRSKARQKASGEYTGGEAEPYGYRRVDGRLQVDPEEAAVIHAAVGRLASGESVSRITCDLNDAGHTTSRGARWRPKTLRRLLVSDHLTGARGYPPILSDEEAAVARSVFSQEERSVGRPPGRRHPLSGILRCANCGTKLGGHANAYRCHSGNGGCGQVSIRAFPLERWLLLESLRRWLEVGDRTPAPAPAETGAGLEELREIERSLEETRALVGQGVMRPADAAPILTQLAARQAEVSERVSRTLRVTPEPPVRSVAQLFTADELRSVGLEDLVGRGSAEEFHGRWEGREPEAVAQVRDLILAVVDHVDVRRRTRPGRGFDPDRVTITWRLEVA